jgi:hypothetical protein
MFAEDGSFDRARGALIRARAEHQLGALERASAGLEEAGRRFTTLGDEGGLFLVACARAEVLGGGPAEVMSRLVRLVQHPVAVRHPILQLEAAATALVNGARVPDADLRALWDEFEPLRDLCSVSGRDVLFYQALAQGAVRSGNVVLAVRAFHRALDSVARIHSAWTTEPERYLYLRGQADLVAEARAFYSSQGLQSEVEALDRLFQPTAV